MHDTNNNDGGVLSGLRVIDCGTYVAGPAAATIMSDFGAEVIKIERPGGRRLMAAFFEAPGHGQVRTRLVLGSHQPQQEKRRAGPGTARRDARR